MDTNAKVEQKFTPGPWEVRFLNESQPEEGFFVEAPNNNMPELGYGIEILMEDFGEHNGYPLEQRLADAYLIAAAPGLIAELGTAYCVLQILSNHDPVIAASTDEVRAGFRNIISRATGIDAEAVQLWYEQVAREKASQGMLNALIKKIQP